MVFSAIAPSVFSITLVGVYFWACLQRESEDGKIDHVTTRPKGVNLQQVCCSALPLFISVHHVPVPKRTPQKSLPPLASLYFPPPLSRALCTYNGR